MKSKLSIVVMSLVAVAVCLCFAQGLGAQSAKAAPAAPGINSFPAASGSNNGCGYLDGNAPAAPAGPEHKPGRGDDGSGKPRLVLTSMQDPRGELEGGAAIVGLWKFTFTSEGTTGIPDGTLIDQGYVTWHADGTEITNSGRPPITGNFCLGVYRQTGRSSFKLNHFGLSWDPTGATLIGPANIKEQVTLGRGGNNYTGTFTIDQFDTNGNLLAHIQGSIAAERITVD
jgi:hypothetical protein